tara:strand:- start:47648 stop:48760 length:1113 start_codon:yes stop_codon:yes gene_type:complete
MILVELWRKPEFKILFTGFFIMFLSFINLLFIEDVPFFKSYAFRQVFWIAIAIFTTLIIRNLRPKMVKDVSLPAYILSIILLVLVLFIGQEISGSKSWIKFGGLFSFQPSEFAKIAFVFIIAKFYSELGAYSKSFAIKYILGALFLLPPFALIIAQPDFGSGFMLLLVSLSIIFTFSYNRIFLIVIFLIFCIISVPLWNNYLKDYQKERIVNFINPEKDPRGYGYNAIQSKIAIGSGKITGKGFGNSSQGKFRFLPEKHTDFAFSVWAEQTGFVGSLFLIALFSFIVIYPLTFLNQIKDQFLQVLLFGMCSYFFFHFMVNICMTLGIFPVVGIPIVMFSYGGSSLLCASIALSIISLIIAEYRDYNQLGV